MVTRMASAEWQKPDVAALAGRGAAANRRTTHEGQLRGEDRNTSLGEEPATLQSMI